MIKVDFKAFVHEYVWFGWQHVPAGVIGGLLSLGDPKWYWLGWQFSFWPVRKRLNGKYPMWYARLFKFRQ